MFRNLSETDLSQLSRQIQRHSRLSNARHPNRKELTMVCSTPQTVSNHLISTTCKMLETGLLDLCSVKHQHSPIAIKITASLVSVSLTMCTDWKEDVWAFSRHHQASITVSPKLAVAIYHKNIYSKDTYTDIIFHPRTVVEEWVGLTVITFSRHFWWNVYLY